MSQENVEIVRPQSTPSTARTWDAVFQDAAPGFELDMVAGLSVLMKGVYRDLIQFGRS